jgi:hypothetical protein
VEINLPGGMDRHTILKAVYRAGQGIHPVVPASFPGMSCARIAFPLQNQVQIWPWLKVEGDCVADAFAVREARAIDSKRRANGEEVIDVAPIGAAITEFPVNADRSCLASHNEATRPAALFPHEGAEPNLSYRTSRRCLVRSLH